MTYRFTAPLWQHSGPAGWHFVTLPPEIADELEVRFADRHRPFGSVAVRASVGEVAWETSLFRDTQRESYLLPVKAAVRRRAKLAAGDDLEVELAL